MRNDTTSSELPLGRYRHYKGHEYTVLGLARHSETMEELVVYRQEYGSHGLWVRPKAMFLEKVRVDEQEVPRFQHLASTAQNQQAARNLLAELPPNLPDELFTTLLSAMNVRIERIVSQGQASPESFWYDQDQHEWVLVLKGAARLRFEGTEQTLEMKPGDFVNIPAHLKHRVDWTTPNELTVWLAVFYE